MQSLVQLSYLMTVTYRDKIHTEKMMLKNTVAVSSKSAEKMPNQMFDWGKKNQWIRISHIFETLQYLVYTDSALCGFFSFSFHK